MKPHYAYLPMALLLTYCAPEAESKSDMRAEVPRCQDKIIGGTRTDSYPTVGYITSGDSFCTATLIARNAVLTAAHCFESTTDGGDFTVDGVTYGWYKAVLHADPDTNDIAVVILRSAVQGLQPSALHTATPYVGQSFTLVGTGATPEGNDNGDKHVGTNTISEIDPVFFGYEGHVAGHANNCRGDSGGPAFIGEQVAGVTSSGEGNGDCTFGTGWNVRVDPFVSWINSILISHPPSATPDPGGAGGTGGTDGSGGASGASGTDGASGPSGADGAGGTDGASGADGAGGTDGASGADGAGGTDGASGTGGTGGSCTD